jgi:hypothetical protein
MVAPGFLQNPEVRRWLNGVEPAWTMLEFDSFNALHDEPSASNHAIRLEPNLPPTDLSGSAVTRNALLLLRLSIETGLKLTATGNLSRAVVAEMFESMEWPGLDKDAAFQFHKVINEPDFLPLISSAYWYRGPNWSEHNAERWFRPAWAKGCWFRSGTGPCRRFSFI